MNDDAAKRLHDRLEWLATVHQAGRWVAAFEPETLTVAVVDTVCGDGLVVPLTDRPKLICLLSSYDLKAAILGWFRSNARTAREAPDSGYQTADRLSRWYGRPVIYGSLQPLVSKRRQFRFYSLDFFWQFYQSFSWNRPIV